MIVFDDNSYLLSFIWASPNLASGRGATVLGFNGPTSTEATTEGLAEVVEAFWDEHLKPVLDSNYTLDIIRVETQAFSIDRPVAVAGTRSGVSCPPNTSVLDTKSASGKGPRARGRNYWPGFALQADVGENGVIPPARIATLNAALEAFYDELVTVDPGFHLSLPQSDVEGQKTEPALHWPEVVSRGIQAKAATQRRRLRT